MSLDRLVAIVACLALACAAWSNWQRGAVIERLTAIVATVNDQVDEADRLLDGDHILVHCRRL